jgi:hypothetical protein
MSAERLLDHLLAEARASATTYAVRRLLQRRPDLEPPGKLPVIVPAEEDAAFELDKVRLLAWIARQVDGAVEVEASTALRSGASWAEVAEATRTTEEQARARYGHLASDRSDERVSDPAPREASHER